MPTTKQRAANREATEVEIRQRQRAREAEEQPDTRTPAERNAHTVAELEVEQLDLETAVASHPRKYAKDLNQWQANHTACTQRLTEIEGELRERREWGYLVDVVPEALGSHIGNSRGLRQRYEKTLQNYAYPQDRRPVEKPLDDLTSLWRTLTELLDALVKVDPKAREDDHVRNVMARELDFFAQLEKCLILAELRKLGSGNTIPVPELGDRAAFPSWVRYGVSRVDHLAAGELS